MFLINNYGNALKTLLFAACLFFTNQALSKDIRYKPFILASIHNADIQTVLQDTKSRVKSSGFQVIGEVSPYEDTHILVVTNAKLKKLASQSDFGAFGAAQRITVTKAGNDVQVAFTHPTYLAHAYRMNTDLAETTQALKQALGFMREYGDEEGLTKEELRDYQYKWLMPYFSDRLELANYPTHEKAVAKINAILGSNTTAVSKIYQVDLDQNNETVIGVQLKGKNTDDCSSDRYIMSRIDFDSVKSSGHLPYEIIIKNNNVYALPAEFRIAISFPGLSMMGSNSFASIMCAPNSIKAALTTAVGGVQDEEF